MEFLKTKQDFSLISINTPLLSNLNIIENIALIKEVHETLCIKKAEALSLEYLQRINFSHIGFLRPIQCNEIEKFYALFIRALMTKERDVIILSPLSLLNTTDEVESIFNDLIQLNQENKNILILDILTNEVHYEGCICHIIK